MMQALMDTQLNEWYRGVLRAPSHRGMRKFTLFGREMVVICSPAVWTAVYATRTHMPEPLFARFDVIMRLVRPLP